MKRGVSLMTAFCGVFFLAVFLEIGALAVLLLPLWLYSFFDSYNLRSQTDAEAAANPDDYLFGLSDMDAEKMDALLRRRHSLIGWGLVLLGIYMLWQRLASWLETLFPEIFGWDMGWNFYYFFRYSIPRLVVTVGIIALGIWFIRGPRKVKSEDIPSFVPPEGPAVDGAACGEAEQTESEEGHGDD